MEVQYKDGHFCVTLEAARVNVGMTQIDAAKACGVTRETIGNWERGVTQPSNVQLLGLSQIYGIPVQYIFLPTQFPKEKE